MRTYKRKTERGNQSELLKQAASIVILENESVRKIAKDFGISHGTLNRLVNKLRERSAPMNTTAEIKECLKTVTLGYSKSRQVFNEVQEKELVEHMKSTTTVCFGLSPQEVRQCAYKCAAANNLRMPQSWIDNKKAGTDWFSSFIKRNPTVPIRTPEANLGRASSFNHDQSDIDDENQFFNQLPDVSDRLKFKACNTWNVGETDVTTGQRLYKLVGDKTSGQRGTLLSETVNSIGNTASPMIMSLCMNSKACDDPTGYIGVPSTLIDSEDPGSFPSPLRSFSAIRSIPKPPRRPPRKQSNPEKIWGQSTMFTDTTEEMAVEEKDLRKRKMIPDHLYIPQTLYSSFIIPIEKM